MQRTLPDRSLSPSSRQACSLEDGLAIVAARGRLMQTLCQSGAMAAAMTDEATAQAAIAGEPRLIAVEFDRNSPPDFDALKAYPVVSLGFNFRF